ncbi:conserved hypothetical protein [Vibrio cholerae MAK 757]|uniref:SMc04008-like domain-containing protein n=7 Tax=Vibrio cholerae TaxID=666 RepID=Q9KQN5_VIBCH|nr:conserved hypothetical protein [Vibrio cholerae O1 biovar El Tor str. N16961]ABQ20197.1 conserved hypothetical protein [Vibrio cholerae O395]ACP06192.1 conserved hypothetical protein [Vibrio cholerae M66-2]EAZ71769.1 conserved hypothetical protein [Vibrio cholerae NCTC 8457]EAZ77246.1 conserved hypothetical protein [Vibrio cholerae B33]EET23168.1 conserved hypothetical protein [Vibrio cholerae MO10]EFH78387.1 conserved hypothetical protein [Vibrio cholerae MAK 757]CSA97706.1 protein of un
MLVSKVKKQTNAQFSHCIQHPAKAGCFLSRKSEACLNCNLPIFGYILVAFNMAQKESDVAQFKHQQLSQAEQDKLDAAVFRQLLQHLDQHKEVQNIDLMILADFCRNCLCKWYAAEAEKQGLDLNIDDARERVYGMTYDEWKANHQPPATPEQLAAFEAKTKSKA